MIKIIYYGLTRNILVIPTLGQNTQICILGYIPRMTQHICTHIRIMKNVRTTLSNFFLPFWLWFVGWQTLHASQDGILEPGRNDFHLFSVCIYIICHCLCMCVENILASNLKPEMRACCFVVWKIVKLSLRFYSIWAIILNCECAVL